MAKAGQANSTFIILSTCRTPQRLSFTIHALGATCRNGAISSHTYRYPAELPDSVLLKIARYAGLLRPCVININTEKRTIDPAEDANDHFPMGQLARGWYTPVACPRYHRALPCRRCGNITLSLHWPIYPVVSVAELEPYGSNPFGREQTKPEQFEDDGHEVERILGKKEDTRNISATKFTEYLILWLKGGYGIRNYQWVRQSRYIRPLFA